MFYHLADIQLAALLFSGHLLAASQDTGEYNY
jgi:hypothetical protein